MTTRCPDPATLLLHVLDLEGPGDAAVEGHLAQCEACRAAVAQLRETVNALRLATGRSDGTATPCLDDEWVAAFAEGSVDTTLASPELAHLLTCVRCRRRVGSVARMLGDADVAEEVRRLAPRPVHHLRPLRIAGAIAAVAAAVLFVVIGRTGTPRGALTPTYREPSPTGAIPPVPLAPVGSVRAADSLRWRSVPRANRYRLTVFDHDGSVRWEGQTTDTVVALPRALAEPSDATYLWRVEAHVGWEDRWVASELTEFSVRRAP